MPTTTSPSMRSDAAPPFEPVDFDSDGVIDAYLAHRREGLARLVPLIAARIEPGQAEALLAAAGLLDGLDRADPVAWRSIATHPYYGHWWTRLSQLLRDGDRGGLGRWAPHLARFVLAPALCSGGLGDGVALTVPLGPDGLLRIPGLRRHLRLPGALGAGGVASLTVRRGEVVVAQDGRTVAAVPSAALTGAQPDDSGIVVTRPSIPGTEIEVDATDPWTTEFMAYLNAVDPPPGRAAGRMLPGTVDEDALTRLRGHLDSIELAWPAMRREIDQYVRLLVPIDDPDRDAFTNTSWPGALFARASFADPVYTVERLVHETSHLRLNLVMDQVVLHHHGWSDTVPSPFRAGPRPVNGLYHGAFVFTRVAAAMDRLIAQGADDRFAARIPGLTAPVVSALATIDTEVRLTAAGRDLLEQVRCVVTELEDLYGTGVVDPDDPTIDF